VLCLYASSAVIVANKYVCPNTRDYYLCTSTAVHKRSIEVADVNRIARLYANLRTCARRTAAPTNRDIPTNFGQMVGIRKADLEASLRIHMHDPRDGPLDAEPKSDKSRGIYPINRIIRSIRILLARLIRHRIHGEELLRARVVVPSP
jgi:hypothetical protein